MERKVPVGMSPGCMANRFAGDVAAQPFADGVATATELARGGLEAVGAGEGDERLMQPMTIGAHTI